MFFSINILLFFCKDRTIILYHQTYNYLSDKYIATQTSVCDKQLESLQNLSCRIKKTEKKLALLLTMDDLLPKMINFNSEIWPNR